jgi:hypothetical protein
MNNRIEELAREKNRIILMSSFSPLEPSETKRLQEIDNELTGYDQEEVREIQSRLDRSFPSKQRILRGE